MESNTLRNQSIFTFVLCKQTRESNSGKRRFKTPNKLYEQGITGATTFPVWPICIALGTIPASTAAREAPTAALSLSASWKLIF